MSWPTLLEGCIAGSCEQHSPYGDSLDEILHLYFERSRHTGWDESMHLTGVKENLRFAGMVDDLMDVSHVSRSMSARRRWEIKVSA
jgi:hypothetical protein